MNKEIPHKLRLGTLIIALLIPLLVGMTSAALSAEGMASYKYLEKPPLSPPAWVFSAAWTVLYLMMGLSSYYIFVSETDAKRKSSALLIYGLQLALNFMWSIIFFRLNMFLLAYLWLCILWCFVLVCIFRFLIISRSAGLLLIPYALWLSFAGYLNMGAYLLNAPGKKF